MAPERISFLFSDGSHMSKDALRDWVGSGHILFIRLRGGFRSLSVDALVRFHAWPPVSLVGFHGHHASVLDAVLRIWIRTSVAVVLLFATVVSRILPSV